MVKAMMLMALAPVAQAQVSVMVFGDSFGDTGPTYHQVQDMFDTRGVKADVRSAAVGGTRSCQWAAEEDGNQLVLKAQSLFPELQNGPEYVWYTLGGNDIWSDDVFQSCLADAKGNGDAALHTCIDSFLDRIIDCHSTMFDKYQAAFPKSKIMQAGYDAPCGSLLCELTLMKMFAGKYCGTSISCQMGMMDYWNTEHLARMQAKYSAPFYTAINLMGAIQKAEGVPGADLGKPVLTQGGKCEWITLCIHPSYNTPAGIAWGDGMWDLYFSKQNGLNSTSVVV